MCVCHFFFAAFDVFPPQRSPRQTALQPKAASLNPPHSLIKTEGSASLEKIYYFFSSQIFF